MADLILLTIADQEPVRCASVAEAEILAKTATKGPIVLAITPAGGGPMTELEYDQANGDWIAGE